MIPNEMLTTTGLVPNLDYRRQCSMPFPILRL